MAIRAIKTRHLLQILLLLCVVLLLLAWWRQRTEVQRVRQENERLTQQGPTPGIDVETLTALPPPPALPAAEQEQSPLEPTPAELPKGHPEPAEDMVMTPTGFATAPRTSGLTLAGTHAAPVEGGLRATMRFNPTTTEPLGIVAVVVRLPLDGESRILGLEPTGSMEFSDVSRRISEDGKFAIYHGTATAAGPVEFALSVSGEAVADVRGTCGIGPFDLEVSSIGATVRPK